MVFNNLSNLLWFKSISIQSNRYIEWTLSVFYFYAKPEIKMIVESLVLFLTLNYICIWCVYIVKKQSFCNRLKGADPQFQLTKCNRFANTCLPGTLAGILPTLEDTAISSEWPEHPTPKDSFICVRCKKNLLHIILSFFESTLSTLSPDNGNKSAT